MSRGRANYWSGFLSVVVVIALVASGCGQWVTAGTGQRTVRIETDPPGAVIWKGEGANRQPLGRSPYTDRYDYVENRYQRSSWCYPSWLGAAAIPTLAGVVAVGGDW